MSSFDKVIGYAGIRGELERICDVLKDPEKYKKLGVVAPRGVLLYGEPGLGKTLIAKCFIEESGCKVFTIRKDKPNGAFVNQIKKTYEKAKSAERAIVFLDDMDKFANEDENHRDAEEYVTVQTCIDESREAGVFNLATVNDRFCLPNSLLRAGRFDKVLEIQKPKGEDARKIISHFLSNKAVNSCLDIDLIVRLLEGQSNAELETMINEAGIYAGFEGRDRISETDIIRSCLRTLYKAPESADKRDVITMRKIATHEAGHAVVGEILEPGCVNLVSVKAYMGNTGGITSFRISDQYNLSKDLHENELIRTLAGKAAVDMVYGEADLGCSSDINKAFGLEMNLVDDYCVYGFDGFYQWNSSEFLKENRDRLTAREIEKKYQKAKRILTENRELFELVIEELMKKEVLTCKDIRDIKAKRVQSL